MTTGKNVRWEAVNTGLPRDPFVNCLATKGANLFAGLLRPEVYDGEVLIKRAIGLGIFRSTNGGRTWTAVNSGLPSKMIVECFAVSGTNVIAGTGGWGVYISSDNGRSWTALNTGLPPHAYVTSIALNETNLVAGLGDGTIWRLPLSDPSLKRR